MSTKENFNNILSLSSDIKAKYGEKGFFPKSNEAPTFQVVLYSHLKENGWKIKAWIKNKIRAVSETNEEKIVDYSKLKDKYDASAISIGKLFGIKK